MTRLGIFLIGAAVGVAAVLPFGLVAQDIRALGPGSYAIVVGDSAAFAWRLNTVNGTVSVCAVPDDPAGRVAPRCTPWGADIVPNPKR